MARTCVCCSTLSVRRTGDDLHISCHKGFKIRLAGIVPSPFKGHWSAVTGTGFSILRGRCTANTDSIV